MCQNQRMTLIIPEVRVHHRMRIALDESGLSVQTISDELGMSRETVSSWINGRRVPNRAQLIAWAQLTSVPVWWLETGAEEPPHDRGGALAGVARPEGLEPPTFCSVAEGAAMYLRLLDIVSADSSTEPGAL